MVKTISFTPTTQNTVMSVLPPQHVAICCILFLYADLATNDSSAAQAAAGDKKNIIIWRYPKWLVRLSRAGNGALSVRTSV